MGDRWAQRLMRNPLLAPVYEKAYRPLLGWAFMGFDLDHLRNERSLTVRACTSGRATPCSTWPVGRGSSPVPSLARWLPPAWPSASTCRLPCSNGSYDERARAGGVPLRRRDEPAVPGRRLRRGQLLCRALPDPGPVRGVRGDAARPPPGRAHLVDDQPRVAVPPGAAGAVSRARGDRPANVPRRRFHRALRGAGFTEVTQELHGVAQYVSATAPS